MRRLFCEATISFSHLTLSLLYITKKFYVALHDTIYETADM